VSDPLDPTYWKVKNDFLKWLDAKRDVHHRAMVNRQQSYEANSAAQITDITAFNTLTFVKQRFLEEVIIDDE
jgi:hypothetical protein